MDNKRLFKKQNEKGSLNLIAAIVISIVIIIITSIIILLIIHKSGIAKLITNTSTADSQQTEQQANIEEQKKNNLINQITANVKVGDFVNYTAGSWTSEEISSLSTNKLYSGAGEPTNEHAFEFGGYKAGDSRDKSIETSYGGKTEYSSGWRVLSLNSDGSINTIIHAGTPEAFYKPYGENDSYKSQYILEGTVQQEGINAWNYATMAKRDWSMYVNKDYATSAHCLTYSEALAINGSTEETNDDLRNLGAHYWLSTAFNDKEQWYVNASGKIANYRIACYGIRPVVTLNSNTKLSGGSGTFKDPYILLGSEE